MISILSSGYGRLHLAQAAECLGKVGIDVKLVCGWVPKNPDSWLVCLCSRLVGRNLAPGLRKRTITLGVGGEVYPCAWVDFLCNGLLFLERKLFRGRLRCPIMTFMWSVFGWQTRRYIRKIGKRNARAVFHVRSGAGQGGAIKLAKKMGMKVLVDHSALHPEQSEINLKADCKRWESQTSIAPHSGVWRNVLADCAEADILMVNANHIRDSFVERGYDYEKIRVVYLGVRDDFRDVTIKRLESGRKNEVPKILYTGNFSILKGAEYLLEAVRILDAQGIKVHCDIVGAVSIPKAMLDKYRGLPTTFHGPVPQDDLKHFLGDADIYLFPSLADGCAQSGMEALTAGLPVIATYQSGLPIIDGETGCVVPMKDARAIANKIEWIVMHPEEGRRLAENAAKMMREKYTWEKYAENVKKIYEDMLGSC